MIVIWFALAAAVGAMLRAIVTDLDAEFNRQMFATLIVNVVGSFVLGALTQSASPELLTIVGVGGVGALTTFSKFVAQIECIHREGSTFHAALYALGTLAAGIAAAVVGYAWAV